MAFSSYQQSLDFLYHRNEFAVKLGLENIRAFLDLEALSAHSWKIIHVAGTNGKGSVCHYLEGWLPALGFKQVGVFTSPHLVSFRERIRLNGRPVSPDWVCNWLGRNRIRIEKIGLTYFECVTAMALEYFSEQRCDGVVLETGLGGRLDATNCLIPSVAVITSISLDHTAVLGDTEEAIFQEKLGILKPGVPAVVNLEHPSLKLALKERAITLKCPAFNIRTMKPPVREPAGVLAIEGRFDRYSLHHMGALSQATLNNLQIALVCLETLRGGPIEFFRSGRPEIPENWGRQQSFEAKGFPRLFLDVSHNSDGVRSMGEHLRDHFSGDPITLVFSVMADKQIPEMLWEIAEMEAETTYYLELTEIPKALKWERLLEYSRGMPINWIPLKLSKESLNLLLQGQGGMVVIFGSFYLLGRVLPWLADFYPQLLPFKRLQKEEDGVAALKP